MTPRFLGILGCVLLLLGVGGLVASEDDLRDEEYTAEDTYANHEPLFAPKTIGQTFRVTANNFNGIGLHLAPYTRVQPTGRVILHLRTSRDTTEDLRRVTFPALVVRRDIMERFFFEPIPDSRGRTYFLLLEYPDGGPDRAIGVRYEFADTPEGRDYAFGERFLDGAPAGGDLAFALYHRERPMAAVQLFSALIVFGVAAVAGRTSLLPSRWSARERVTAVLLVGIPLLAVLPLLRNIRSLGLENWDPLLPVTTSSPFALFIALFGSTVGTKLAATFHVVVGYGGLFFLLRASNRSRLASFVGASVFFLSPFLALHIAYGHLHLVALAWVPWILFFLRKGITERRFLVLASLGVALLLLEARLSPALPALTFILSVSAIESLRRKERRPLLAAVLSIVLGTLLAGASLVPAVLSGTFAEPHADHALTSLPARTAIDLFLDPRQLGFVEKFPGQSLPWYEYGAYVGLFPLALSLLAMLRMSRTRALLLAVGALFLLGALHPGAHVALEALPGVGASLHPQRLVGFVVLVIALLTAAGFDDLRELLLVQGLHPSRAGRWIREVAYGLFAAIIIGDLLFVSGPTSLTAFVVPPTDAVTPLRSFPTAGLPVGLLLTALGLLGLSSLWTSHRRSGIMDRFVP